MSPVGLTTLTGLRSARVVDVVNAPFRFNTAGVSRIAEPMSSVGVGIYFQIFANAANTWRLEAGDDLQRQPIFPAAGFAFSFGAAQGYDRWAQYTRDESGNTIIVPVFILLQGQALYLVRGGVGEVVGAAEILSLEPR